MENLVVPGFWFGKRVLITGHTGFKGAWLSFWLAKLGAEVSGIALPPSTDPNLHDLLNIPSRGMFAHADINDRNALDALIAKTQPEIIFHMAAQALVRTSYVFPVETFTTNVIGTVNLLDAVRACPATCAVVVVTTDKAYENREWEWGYREIDALGGYDPYSASKGCAELATASMRRSFYGKNQHKAKIATVRAGNVIGGGDWSEDRLVPDIVRGCLGAEGIVRLRNPGAVRPWQHVLDPLAGYLALAERLCSSAEGFDEAWNIGPEASSSRPVRDVAEAIIAGLGRGVIDITPQCEQPHEANFLTLDCSKARSKLGWRPRLDFSTSVTMTVDWYAAWATGGDLINITHSQIDCMNEMTV